MRACFISDQRERSCEHALNMFNTMIRVIREKTELIHTQDRSKFSECSFYVGLDPLISLEHRREFLRN